MMKWRMLHRRRYLLIAVLAITLAAGTFTSTAYAKFRGPGVQAHNFSVTYVGITCPVDSMHAYDHRRHDHNTPSRAKSYVRPAMCRDRGAKSLVLRCGPA